MSDVLIVGTGLLGTSLGLALTARADLGLRDVALHDLAEAHLSAAVTMGAGRPWDGTEGARVVIVAVPPPAIPPVLMGLRSLGLGQTYMHIGSVQSYVQAEVEAWDAGSTNVLGCHPLAGKELSGPAAAEATLFAGRRWAVCPWTATAQESIEEAGRVARACGAEPVVIGPEEHDAAVALSSHLPHLASVVLAGLLVDGSSQALTLAGPGLADMTRLAAGDSELWREILTRNASPVSGLAELLGQRLLRAAELLRALDGTALAEMLRLGQQGRAMVPVKRGLQDTGFERVTVVLPDVPGQLAALFAAAAAVNIEDVHVEHAVGEQSGRVGLWVARTDSGQLRAALAAAGWSVTG